MWMTVCIVVELRAWRTGRRSVRLPGSRSAQSVAAFLIGTTLTVSALGRSAQAITASSPVASSTTRAPNTTLRVIDDVEPWDVRPPLTASAGTRRGIDDVDVAKSVQGVAGAGRRTSLAVLDDLPVPERPPEWAPRSAPRAFVGPPAVTEPTARNTGVDGSVGRLPGTHVVVPRETLWSIASDRLGSPLRWKEIAAINYGLRQPDGGQLSEDHWIRPGWVLHLPGMRDSAPPAELTSTPAPVTTAPDVSTEEVTVPGGRVSVAVSGSMRNGPVPVVPIGGSIVGAGVVSILDRMRKAQQRHRTEGTLIRLPDPARRRVEERLRVGDGMDTASLIDATVERLHLWRHNEGRDVPRVRGVRLHDELELILDEVEEPRGIARPFTATDGGRSLVVDRSDIPRRTPVDGAMRTTRSPAPLLVTAGRADDETIMVNLEPLGSLTVQGERGASESVLRSLALELATSYWSGQFELILVGFGGELQRFTRVKTTSDVPTLIDLLCTRRVAARAQLGSTEFASFAEARALTRAEQWDPLVVICGSSVEGRAIEEILDVGADAEVGMVVIAAGVGRGSSHVVTWSSDHSATTLDLLASVVEPQMIDDEEMVSVTSLLETATSRDAMLTSDEPYV